MNRQLNDHGDNMCGILGGNIANWDYSSGINAIKHRGPDAQKVIEYAECTLAFARLSIMDLSMAAMQPMESEDGQVVILFNGEIYGFEDIRNALASKYKFRTTSDTEVILYAYMEYGDKFADYIDGMFAIVIYDKRKAVLKIFRDRYGIKPLYYYYQDSMFAFASELKAFQAAAVHNWQWKVDNTAIYDYLFCGYIPEPKSLYENVYRLEPANYLVYDLRKKRIIKKERYWRLHVNTNAHGKRNRKSIREDIRYLIAQSVKEQMVADVNVGTYLSGGVDSSIITYECSQVNKNIAAFSIGFPVKAYDETPYAEIVAQKHSINHKVKYFDKNNYSDMKGLLYQLYDEPYADTSAYPTYFLSQFAKEEVTVVLTGDGGDELFGGYETHKKFCEQEGRYLHDNYNFERFVNSIFSGHDMVSSKIRDITQTKFTTYCKTFGRYGKEAYEEFREILKIGKDYNTQWFFQKYYVKDLPRMTRVRYLDFKTYLPSDILTKVDRASMAVSLEARVPLLNRRLVEYVFGLAEDECSSMNNLKAILKDAYRDVIPSEILDRHKSGFAVPKNYFTLRSNSADLVVDIWKKEWKEIKA